LRVRSSGELDTGCLPSYPTHRKVTTDSPRHPVWENYKVDFPPDYDLDWGKLTIVPLSEEEAELQYLKKFNELWLAQ